MQPRTRRQKEVLEIINRYIKNHGYEPSYQQIAIQLGVRSKGGIARHIKSLEGQGLLSKRGENGKFNLKLQSESAVVKSVSEIEWLDVPKDKNLLAEDWEAETLFVPNFMLGYQEPECLRAFRVPDNSMLDEHILEGDIVLIEKRAFARDGDIVVAVIENKRALLNKYFRAGAKVELRPANPHFDSTILSADKISLRGILRCVLRPTA